MGSERKKHRFTGMSIPAKLVLLFFLFLIPIYLLLLVSAVSYMHSLERQAGSTASALLDLNLSELDAEVRRVDQYFYNLQETNTNYQYLADWSGSGRDWVAMYNVNRILYDQNEQSSYSSSYFLYLESEDYLLFVNQSLEPAQRRLLRDALMDACTLNENHRWSVCTIEGSPYLFHTIGYYGVYLGALLDLDSITDTLREQLGFANASFTIGSGSDSNASGLCFREEIHNTGQFLQIRLDRNEIRRSMPRLSRLILILGGILIAVLPVILVLTFAQMLVRPLHRVEEGIKRFGRGDPDYRIAPFRASREFIGLKDSFNTMADEIRTLKIRNYEEQLEQERMLLQNLLLQIRPHFLLNFFNQIFSMAELEDYRGIQKSSLYLSSFFRYLFCADQTAALGRELALVDDYLELMNERFPDCFSVERRIDPSLLDCRIPPLLVQNFVENIFKYAITDGTLTNIGLSLQREGRYAVMTVSDDGPGMDEETLRQIREARPIEKADGTHIGIYNSTYRLKKLCGEDCRLDIRSAFAEGTTVRILLPVTADTEAKEA